MSTLIAITYDTADKATQALEKLGELQKMQLVTLEDAAVAVKDQKGKVKVTQTLEKMHTGSAAVWGGFWGLLIGLLFLAPIFWGLFLYFQEVYNSYSNYGHYCYNYCN